VIDLNLEYEAFITKYPAPVGITFNHELFVFEKELDKICDYSYQIKLQNLLLQCWLDSKNSNTIEVDWLDECPACNTSDAIITSEKGSTSTWLHDGDIVKCNCGKLGEIETDCICAWVEWEDENK